MFPGETQENNLVSSLSTSALYLGYVLAEDALISSAICLSIFQASIHVLIAKDLLLPKFVFFSYNSQSHSSSYFLSSSSYQFISSCFSLSAFSFSSHFFCSSIYIFQFNSSNPNYSLIFLSTNFINSISFYS